jgi:hypothetical protein
VTQILYNGARVSVLLQWTQLLFGVFFDPFGGIALHFGILIVTLRKKSNKCYVPKEKLP